MSENEGTLSESEAPEDPRRRGRNAYVCLDCHRFMVTVDRRVGVTPFMMPCPGCRGHMQSLLYQLGPAFLVAKPDGEWFVPTDEECKRLTKPMLEHVQAGGLVFRALTPHAPDVASQWKTPPAGPKA